MPNKFEGVGNLADAPAIKNCVAGNGRKFKAAEMRIFFDDYARDNDGNYSQTGGIWMRVTAYDHNAESCARLLQKGARVKVEGRLVQFPARDEGGNEVDVSAVEASHVYLSLARVGNIEFAAPRGRAAGTNADDQSRQQPEYYEPEPQF